MAQSERNLEGVDAIWIWHISLLPAANAHKVISLWQKNPTRGSLCNRVGRIGNWIIEQAYIGLEALERLDASK